MTGKRRAARGRHQQWWCMSRMMACAAVVVGAILAVDVAALQRPVFRGEGDLVPVFVTVTDDTGRLVTTLTRDDFVVSDNGRPQPLMLFDVSPQPLQLVVLIDVSGSMVGNLPLLRMAAEQLFSVLAPHDRVRVATFGRQLDMGTAFTNDPVLLRGALPESIAPDAPTPLWLALDEALTVFDDVAARRVVLVLSDGRDSGSVGFRRRPSSQVQVIEQARSRDVMIYAIGLRSRGARAPLFGVGAAGLASTLAADMPDPGLARVAEETGGGYLELRGGEDLGSAFTQVADELRRQYLLGFVPPERDGKIHRIDVAVLPRDLTPRARREYVAPRP